MDWDKLRIFISVINNKSYAKASESIHLSPSAISRQITELENSVGSRLFNRHSRGLALTNSGEILYRAALDILSKVQETEALLKRDSTDLRGPLKLTTTHAIASGWLTLYLDDFIKKHPEINLTIIGHDEQLDLQVRQADVAIRTAIPHQSDLTQMYLTTFHLGIYASQNYLRKFGVPKKPRDLDDHRLLTFGDNIAHPYGNINWILNIGLVPGERPRSSFLRINSAYGLRRCVELGIGIGALSKEYAALAEDIKLVPLLEEYEMPTVDLYYVYPRSLEKIRRFTVLGEFLRERLKING